MSYPWPKIKNTISQICMLIVILCCLYIVCAMIAVYWKLWIVIFIAITIAVLTEKK